MTDQPVTPYLTVEGAAEAIDYYKAVFGAVEVMRQAAEENGRLLHAELTINGGSLMLSDHFPEYGYCEPPSGGSSVAVALKFAQAADVDRVHASAVEHGGRSEIAPDNAFWGAYFAVIWDPFGHRWMLSGPKKQ